MKTSLTSIAFLVLSLSHSFSFGDSPKENWHQWRGPEATGVSRTANPPIEWSEDKNVKWKVSVDGRGTSTPIVWNDKVFLLTAIDTGVKDTSIPDPKDQPKTNFFDIKRPNTEHAFVVLCLDRESGKELWRRTATKKIPHEGAHNDNDFASASPTTDGKQLYCWFGSAGLYCFDLDGNKLWERDLGEAKVGSSLGEGCSPVLHDGKLVIVRDHAGQSSIEVLDAETGDTLWQRERDEDNAWATPRVIQHSGKTQVITAASGAVRSYDLDSGEIIWQCSGLTGNVTPCPVIDGDYVICMSGYQGYAAMAIPSPKPEISLVARRSSGRETAAHPTSHRRFFMMACSSTTNRTSRSSPAWTPRRARRFSVPSGLVSFPTSTHRQLGHQDVSTSLVATERPWSFSVPAPSMK